MENIDRSLPHLHHFIRITGGANATRKTALGKNFALIGWPWCLELPGVKAHNEKQMHMLNKFAENTCMHEICRQILYKLS